MCNYSAILGDGEVLVLQLLTIISIVASIFVWIWFYLKNDLEKELWEYAPPIMFWTIFGILDIVITAKGTFNDPLRENNPLARIIFVETGYFGPIVASIFWIALWAVIVLLINQMQVRGARFFSFAIFWSLAVGHFFGFSSWFIPFCSFRENVEFFFIGLPHILKIILIGSAIAMFHISIVKKH